MTWSDFYLFCFIIGFTLVLISFLAGAVHIHLPFKMHLPFSGGHHGGASGGAHISRFNALSALMFLAWFGGTGYLLTRHAHLVALLSLSISTVAGAIAAWVIFRFMVKLMQTTDLPIMSADYRLEGSLGRVSMGIRENGTGEIIFSLAGVRKCAGARTDDGKPIEKGAEVVIERYDKGIAYVKRWEEFSSNASANGTLAKNKNFSD
jgi:membrane protein implicated in regulation of membrane protease activity